jgi:hypothetical protein
MSEFISDDPLNFLPRVVGGLGLPYIGDREVLYERVLERSGSAIVALYTSVSSKLTYHNVIDFLIRRMSTGNQVRGIMDPMTFLVTSQYANLAFNLFQDKCKTFDEFKKEFQALKSYEVSNKDVSRFIKASGYISYHSIAENLDRITAIRFALAACCSEFLSPRDLLPAKEGRLPSPSEVLDMFLKDEINVHSVAGFRSKDLSTCSDDYSRFYNWVVTENCKEFISPQRLLWIPREAIVDSMNGMTVALPYDPSIETDLNPIPGSLADLSVDPTIEGWETKVVSLHRLKLA